MKRWNRHDRRRRELKLRRQRRELSSLYLFRWFLLLSLRQEMIY